MDHDDVSGDLPAWVTDFDSPEVARPRDKPSASRPMRFAARVARSRPTVVPIIAGAGSLAAVAAIVITALARPIEEEAGTGGGPIGEVPRPSVTAPTATSAPDVSTRIPNTCADLYGADMKRVLTQAGLEVNSAWTGSRNLPAGSADEQLLALLAEEDALGCFWLDELGGADSALLTLLADTTEETTESAMARLTELGLTRREEHGGVRFFVEARDGSGELYGESHFFREGLWFATRWYGPGQFGYTADMAQRVFS